MKIRHLLACLPILTASIVLPAIAAPRDFPSVERSWKTSDYERFGTALEKTKIAKWPRWKKDETGSHVAKFLELEPMDGCVDTSADPEDRFVVCLDMMQAVTNSYQQYALHFMSSGDLDDETMVLAGALLKVAAAINAAGDDFLATIPADDPTLPVRLEGLDMMKRGQVQMVEGAIMMLESRVSEKSGASLVLAQDLAATLPVILTFMSETTQSRLKEKMQKLTAAETDPAAKALFSPLVSSAN